MVLLKPVEGESSGSIHNSSDNRYGSTGSTIINCTRFVSEFNA